MLHAYTSHTQSVCLTLLMGASYMFIACMILPRPGYVSCEGCEGWDGVRSNCCDILFRQLLSAGVVPVDYLERRFCVSQDPRVTVES